LKTVDPAWNVAVIAANVADATAMIFPTALENVTCVAEDAATFFPASLMADTADEAVAAMTLPLATSADTALVIDAEIV